MLLFGTISSLICYVLLYFTWHGNTSPWESIYIAPGGFGTGIAQTAVFTSIQASVCKKKRAPALAGMFLVIQLGFITGLTAVGTLVMETVRWKLDLLLAGMDMGPAARSEVSTRNLGIFDQPRANSERAYRSFKTPLRISTTWTRLVEGFTTP